MVEILTHWCTVDDWETFKVAMKPSITTRKMQFVKLC